MQSFWVVMIVPVGQRRGPRFSAPGAVPLFILKGQTLAIRSSARVPSTILRRCFRRGEGPLRRRVLRLVRRLAVHPVGVRLRPPEGGANRLRPGAIVTI